MVGSASQVRVNHCATAGCAVGIQLTQEACSISIAIECCSQKDLPLEWKQQNGCQAGDVKDLDLDNMVSQL